MTGLPTGAQQIAPAPDPKRRTPNRTDLLETDRPETDRPEIGGPVLTVRDLSIDYLVSEPVHAVRNASFELRRGEIFGLAGESGCGKTTLAYGLNQLHKPPASISAGEVTFHDQDTAGTVDVLSLDGSALRAFRWSKVSMVFQGAMNSLNPVISVRAQLGDVFATHAPQMTRRDRLRRSEELLNLVGVDPERITSFAHELSGGMRQRVMIAMALALDPQLMIMDEPTTALDVVVQREILQEILRLRSELGFAVIFITHDLPLLLEVADRIAVMRTGEIVELGTAEDIYFDPQHDYTAQLLGSFPSLTGDAGDFVRAGYDRTEVEERPR